MNRETLLQHCLPHITGDDLPGVFVDLYRPIHITRGITADIPVPVIYFRFDRDHRFRVFIVREQRVI